jgi:hypothetical protein
LFGKIWMEVKKRLTNNPPPQKKEIHRVGPMDLKIYSLERKAMTVTRWLAKSRDFRQKNLCDFLLSFRAGFLYKNYTKIAQHARLRYSTKRGAFRARIRLSNHDRSRLFGLRIILYSSAAQCGQRRARILYLPNTKCSVAEKTSDLRNTTNF